MSTTTNPETLRHALRRTAPHLVLLVREDRAELNQSRGGTLAPLLAATANPIRPYANRVKGMLGS